MKNTFQKSFFELLLDDFRNFQNGPCAPPYLCTSVLSSFFKGKLCGGETSDTLKIQPNDGIGPIFRSCLMDVSCNISATTQPILDFDAVLERPDL